MSRVLGVPLLHAAGLAAVFAASAFLQAFEVIRATPGSPYLATAFEQFVHAFVMTGTVVAIIAAMEALPLAGARRAAAQAVALAAGVVAAAAAIATLVGEEAQVVRNGTGSARGLFVYFIWMGLAASVLLSWYYGVRARSLHAIRSLHEGALQRESLSRRLVEGNLHALQARVDPSFLQRALKRIDEEYSADLARGEQALESLVDYLSAALRQASADASTLGREADLVAAYVRVASNGSSAVAAPDVAARDLYAPPMVLLPIVQTALGSLPGVGMDIAFASSAQATSALIRFEAPPAWDPAARLEPVRSTLERLFAARAALVVSRLATRVSIEIRWPRDGLQGGTP